MRGYEVGRPGFVIHGGAEEGVPGSPGWWGQCGSNEVVTGTPEPDICFPRPPLGLWAREILGDPGDILRRAKVQCRSHKECGWSARLCGRSQPSDTSLWPHGPRESSTQRNLADKPVVPPSPRPSHLHHRNQRSYKEIGGVGEVISRAGENQGGSSNDTNEDEKTKTFFCTPPLLISTSFPLMTSIICTTGCLKSIKAH